MSYEARPDAIASEFAPREFLEGEGLSDREIDRVLRLNDWSNEALPIDQLKAGLHRALHGRI